MSSCIPKHIACGWWDNEFVAGTEGCTLQTADEHRARPSGVVGGVAFRSAAFHENANNITITSKWMVGAEVYNPPTHTLDDITNVRLSVNDGVVFEEHTVIQTLTPGPGSPDVIISGIDELRATLEDDSVLVRMPLIDAQTAGTGTIIKDPPPNVTNVWDASLDDDDHLGQFTDVTFAGAFGATTASGDLKTIRTGSAYTLMYIVQSENDDGEEVAYDAVRYWNGACWKAFDSVNPDCAGSPLICGIGPETDCP